MGLTGPYTAALCGLLLVGGASAYLAWVLPKLSPAAGLGCTGALAGTLFALTLGVLIAAPTSTSTPWATALGAGLLTLVAGHAGWWLGRQSLPTPASRPVASLPARSPPRSAAGSVPGSPAVPAAAALASADIAEPGTLGRYRIERQIGRGAMGAVYLGRDPQIGRAVAIKTLALASEFEGAELVEARQRFFREAETAGRLQHPDIVTIFDAGEDRDLAYIAMEFLRGHDLQQHTKPGQLLSVATVVHIGERVAAALAHAHSQGVVHRDVKPANVMVDLASGAVKVTDFGIARITDSSRTRTGMVLGTPSFMSPEQMSGQRVDGRADLYSLGVMLFQLLTGQLPHRAESMAKLMYRIANEPAPDLRSVRPDLPDSLARVLDQALSKRPEARQADGRQMAAELRAVAAELPPEAAPATGTEPPTQAPVVPTDSQAFAATVRISRTDPGHNSGL